MSAINRAHTPLIRYDNDLSKDPLTTQEEVKVLTDRQATKSPFEVGSLAALTERIVNLEDELGMFELDMGKFEKLQSGSDPKYFMDDRLQDDNSRRKDFPLVRQFRSAYKKQIEKLDKMPLRFEAVETPGPSSQVVATFSATIDSDAEDNDLSAEDRNVARQMDGKPKFVEMYSFPKFDEPLRLEKLPYGVSLNKIIHGVINSQPGIPQKKPRYAKWMRRIMLKPECRSIVLDLFWWFLLDRFKDYSPQTLLKFETNISDNYRVFLENEVPFDRYRDPFFNSFGSLLAQAVYACFCYVFPDSFSKYNEVFKERLMEICGQWFQGIKIASGSWKNWNYINLEPAGLRLRMEAAEAAAKEDTKRKKGLFSLDWVKNLGSGQQFSYVASEDEEKVETQPDKQVKGSSKKPIRAPIATYKPTGRVFVEKNMLDLAGHTPLLSSSCLRKGADINSFSTHFLLQHRNVKPETFDDEKSTFVRESSQRVREDAKTQIRRVNGFLRSCHINEEKRNKKMRELDKNSEEILADKDKVKRLADILALKAQTE